MNPKAHIKWVFAVPFPGKDEMRFVYRDFEIESNANGPTFVYKTDYTEKTCLATCGTFRDGLKCALGTVLRQEAKSPSQARRLIAGMRRDLLGVGA